MLQRMTNPAPAATRPHRALRAAARSAALATLLAPLALAAQPRLVPSDAAPYARKLDLTAADHEFLLVPEAGEGPRPARGLAFHFVDDSLDALLAAPGTVRYVTVRDGGVHLQLLHLRVRRPPARALGPQRWELRDGGATVARGELLVVARAPEPVELTTADGQRVLDEGQPTPVRLRVRTHGNLAGGLTLRNAADFELRDVRPAPGQADRAPADRAADRPPAAGDAPAAVRVPVAADVAGGDGPAEDSAGVATIAATLRPLHREATRLVVAADTRDGRTVELTFPRLTIRPPAPRRARVAGGPVYLDALGSGWARLSVLDLATPDGVAPDLDAPGGELTVRDERWDRAARRLEAVVEVAPRGPRPAGAREVRDLTVRAGGASWVARVELVAAPLVAGVRAEPGGESLPVVRPGGAPVLVRILGQNLDELRLDCAPLGAAAGCRTVGASPTELAVELAPAPDAPEGELLLPLVATGGRATSGGLGGAALAGVRVRVARPSVPVALAAPGLLALRCGARMAAEAGDGGRGCRAGRDGASLVAGVEAARGLALAVGDSLLPWTVGWQRLVVTVTRLRGAPRLVRRGLPAGRLPLLDPSVEVRHGDALVVRIEHALDQYPEAQRTDPAAAEPWVRTVYVDGGPLRRLAADVAVQPVLYSLEPRRATDGTRTDRRDLAPRYMNAGIGVTWQPMTWRMQPRVLSAKLQLIAMSGADGGDGGGSTGRQPALFLSGNLRVPGSEPTRPIVLTAGLVRLFGAEQERGWRMMAGAGVDLGVARLGL